MSRTRMVMPAGAAAGVVALIALLIGNQWVAGADWLLHRRMNTKSGPLINYLTFPNWRLSPFHAVLVVPGVLCVVVVIVLTAVLTALFVRSLDERRGTFGALAGAWWAVVIAGAVAGLIRAVAFNSLENLPSFTSAQEYWISMGTGAGFGVFFGWLPGLGSLVAYRLTRDSGDPGPAPWPQPQQPWPQQGPPPQPRLSTGGPGQPWPAQPAWPAPPQPGYGPPPGPPSTTPPPASPSSDDSASGEDGAPES